MIFSLTVKSSTRPASFLSSGHRATPRQIEARGEKRLTTRPSSFIVPLSGFSIPNSSWPSSVRPDPSSPAKPSTSPACSSRSSGSIDPVRPSCSASSNASPLICWLLSSLIRDISSNSVMLRPIIFAIRSRRDMLAVSKVPTRLPFLRTVIRSEIS